LGKLYRRKGGAFVIVVATSSEYIEAKKRWQDEHIVQTGVGGLNVVRKLQWYNRDTPIINFGYVGSNLLPIGETVEIGECKLYHPNVEYQEPIYNLGGDIKCYTSNDFVLNTDINETVVFDMELAYILAMGFQNVKSIKIVSDNLSIKEYEKVEAKND
jgi:hypothetical protein